LASLEFKRSLLFIPFRRNLWWKKKQNFKAHFLQLDKKDLCNVWREGAKKVVVRSSYEIRAANFPPHNNWHKSIQIYVNPNDGLCKAEKAWTEYKFSFFTWSFYMRLVFFMNIPYEPAQSGFFPSTGEDRGKRIFMQQKRERQMRYSLILLFPLCDSLRLVLCK
jgi:hypothetical protein